MLKAVAHSNTGEPLVIFGLSGMNIQKLKEGLPILVETEELGFKGKVAIFYAETEEMLAETLLSNMSIDSKAIIDLRDPESLQ